MEHNLILSKNELKGRIKHKEFMHHSKFINFQRHIINMSLNFTESSNIDRNPKFDKQRIDSFQKVKHHHVQQEE